MCKINCFPLKKVVDSVYLLKNFLEENGMEKLIYNSQQIKIYEFK